MTEFKTQSRHCEEAKPTKQSSLLAKASKEMDCFVAALLAIDGLPPGSKIRFREQGACELYRWQIVAVAAALLLQSAVITWLIFERRRRRGAEMEARRRLMEVAQMDRALTVGTMSASLAHELNHPLNAILSNAEAAEMMLAGPAPDRSKLKAILADIRRDMRQRIDKAVVSAA